MLRLSGELSMQEIRHEVRHMFTDTYLYLTPPLSRPHLVVHGLFSEWVFEDLLRCVLHAVDECGVRYELADALHRVSLPELELLCSTLAMLINVTLGFPELALPPRSPGQSINFLEEVALIREGRSRAVTCLRIGKLSSRI